MHVSVVCTGDAVGTVQYLPEAHCLASAGPLTSPSSIARHCCFWWGVPVQEAFIYSWIQTCPTAVPLTIPCMMHQARPTNNDEFV